MTIKSFYKNCFFLPCCTNISFVRFSLVGQQQQQQQQRFYSEYTAKPWSKNNFHYSFFSTQNFYEDNFVNMIVNNFKLHTSYSLLIKFSFSDNRVFYMASRQIGLVIEDTHDLDRYKGLYSLIIVLCENIIARYDVRDELSSVQIMYTVVTHREEFKLVKGLSSLSFNPKLANIALRKNSHLFSSKFIPLTLDETRFGIVLAGDKLSTFIERFEKNRPKGIELPKNPDSYFLNGNYVIISK